MSILSTGRTRSRPGVTVEAYLAQERAATERHEYFDGEIRAMAGETLGHGIISTNLVILIGTQLRGTPCFAVTKDTKVRSGLGLLAARTGMKGMFSYPDIVVICGEPEYFDEHQDVISNPTLIVEVLSPSTELYDRGEKFHRYRHWNPSLKEYVLVAQAQPLVEQFCRKADGKWEMQEHAGLEATVQLTSIACLLKLAEVYDRVAFSEEIDG